MLMPMHAACDDCHSPVERQRCWLISTTATCRRPSVASMTHLNAVHGYDGPRVSGSSLNFQSSIDLTASDLVVFDQPLDDLGIESRDLDKAR